MTTPDHSVQTASEPSPPSLAAPAVPLPAAGPAPVSGRPWRRRAFDWLLAGVVVSFAFLAASFAVRNSDFWLHLACGRLLAEGRYQFGVDPFACTTTGVYWANHAWLFDLVLFLLYQLKFGGAVLVVLKALLIAVLAALMLRIRRPGGGIGVPAACTLLAVLAMSPRLWLHSTCLSYVFLGLAFWLLWRPRAAASNFRQDLKHYAPLLLLFVLWVNVDSWFLLGPLLAALFWLGERIQPARSARDGCRRTPAWLWLAGLAVCLLNPHHWHAFTLPADLMPLPPELRHDPRFQRLFLSYWQLGWPYHPITGLNLVASAYFALVALGLASFLVNARNLVVWRLLVWCGFAGLAAWLARTVPFFAVVAGPITALNWQDFLSRRSTAALPEGVGERLGRVAVFAGGLALIFLAWPGWLQGFALPGAGRRVDWALRPDPSLQHVAETLREWSRDGKLRDGERGFLFHPEVAHYCAWICREEKGFLDSRLPLFRAVADEYEEICRALNPALGLSPPEGGGKRGGGDWREILKRHGITHLVLYDPNLTRLQPALKQLAVKERDWTLLHIDGKAVIVGWKDHDGRRLPEGLPAFDAERAAFAPSAADDEMLPPAPGRGPERGPVAADFWSHFGKPASPPSWETDAASVLLLDFENSAPRQYRERGTRCFSWAASLPGLPALSAGSLDGSLRLLASLEQAPLAPGDLEQRPPALPLLALRAARRALADNPDDAAAYLLLGQAYLALVQLTPERGMLGSFPLLARLRHIQIAVALENTLRRNPDDAFAHEALFNLYGQSGFLDAALDHRREQLRLTRRAGPVAGETAEAFAQRLEQLETSTSQLENAVSDQNNKFTLEAQKMSAEPYHKAQLALRLGLARRALDDILMQSQMVLLGGEGIRLAVELQLRLGRVEWAREQLHSSDWQKNKQNLGYVDLPVMTNLGPAPSYHLPAYDWLLLCQSAAVGDYEQAAAALQTIFDEKRTSYDRDMGFGRRFMIPLLTAELGLSCDPQPGVLRRAIQFERKAMTHELHRQSFLVVEQADLHVLEGMLALERGEPRAAAKSFARSLQLSESIAGTGYLSHGQPLARAYLRILQAARR